MRTFKKLVLIVAACATPLAAQDKPSQGGADQAVNRIISRENQEMEIIRGYAPLVETYIQRVRNDKNNTENWEPSSDRYFMGRAEFSKGFNLEPLEARHDNVLHRVSANMNRFFSLGIDYLPKGFLQMIYPDPKGLDTQTYSFQFVRREFLGEVRTLVFDVTPAKKAGKGRFIGRIWVEDQAFTIVRFNGSYSGMPISNVKFEFDSWRVNAGPNLWLPAFIYSEEKSPSYLLAGAVSSKAQTRLWGYNVGKVSEEEELSKVLIESQNPVIDKSQQNSDLSPIEQKRAWDLEAQSNVMERLQQEGLVARKGEVDKVLETVVNNLEVTNNLNIEPEVRCRVLMTSTLESFTLGRTIVLSRGLIDVLPDEASLAAIIAKQLSYVLLDPNVDTRYGFYDRMLTFDEKATFKHFDFAHSKEEDAAASAKAAELLKNSPYKNQLRTAEMFVAELQRRSKEIPNLISPRLGDAVLLSPSVAADTEDKPDPNQVVALPLGGRVKLNPWDDSLEMLKSKAVANLTERDKMPFEITPFVIYLTRVTGEPRRTSQYEATPQAELGAQQSHTN
jgi:hypothetical protein